MARKSEGDYQLVEESGDGEEAAQSSLSVVKRGAVFHCPHCQVWIRHDAQRAGQKLTCSACKGQYFMPQLALPHMAADPAEPPPQDHQPTWHVLFGQDAAREADRLGVVPLGTAQVIRLTANTADTPESVTVRCSAPCRKCKRIIPFEEQWQVEVGETEEKVPCPSCGESLSFRRSTRLVDKKEIIFVYVPSRRPTTTPETPTSQEAEPDEVKKTTGFDDDMTIDFVSDESLEESLDGESVEKSWSPREQLEQRFGRDEKGEVRYVDASELDIDDQDLAALNSLSKLEDLVLRRTKISDEGFGHLSTLKNLAYLDLEETKITGAGFRWLSELVNLRCLRLDATRIHATGLEHLEPLPQLASLWLRRTKLAQSQLRSLGRLSQLWHSLHLEDTTVTDEGLKYLSGLDKLAELYLCGTRVSDAGLVHLSGLPNLQRLDLARTDITDAGCVYLNNLPKLKYLRVTGTKITDAGIASLQEALPDLKISCSGTPQINDGSAS